VIDTLDSLIDIADRVIDIPGLGRTSGDSDRHPGTRIDIRGFGSDRLGTHETI